MGVKGLWRLLMPIGRRISIETLEGKILAVDASIWLTQFLSAMRDPDTGKVRPAAHLIGFFRRLCKLRYQGIRPVFVFDGPTPEIKQRELRDRRKRREQFSNDLSGEAIQRMAKQLLVQQLKKKGVAHITKAKITNNNSGGTNDAPRDRSIKPNPSVEADVTTATGAFAPGFYDPEMETSGTARARNETQNQESTKEIFEVLDDGTDYLNLATSQVNDQSDWDSAITDMAVSESLSGKESESQVRHGDLGTYYASADPDDFNPEYVASLPSTKRKDIVEEAQRSRRLQSRREFMKVASDPAGLSKCQLRNFLKSSKLNQNIHKMAQEATKAQGMTETLASDRSKRIIFETKHGVDDQVEAKRKKEKELEKIRGNRKLSILASSDEESDDSVDWEGDSVKGSNNFKVAASKPMPIVDYSDSEEERHSTGFQSPPRVATLPRNARRILEEDFDSSDRESGGDCAKEGGISIKPNVVVIDDSICHENDSKMPARPRHSDADGDLRLAQALNDEMLARVLQESEYGSDDGGGFLPSKDITEPNTVEQPRDPGRIVKVHGGFGPKQATNDTVSSEDDNGGVEWEDGSPATEVGKAAAKPASAKTSSVETDVLVPVLDVLTRRSNVHFDYDGTKTDGFQADAFEGHSSRKPVPQRMAESKALFESEDDDEDGVEWQDAEACEKEAPSKTFLRRETRRSPEDDLENIDNAFGWKKEYSQEDSNSDGDDSWEYGSPSRTSTRPKPNELSAALEQAQVTAANLTNWAGRSFRRAVAQHAAEAGLTTPPGTNLNIHEQPAAPSIPKLPTQDTSVLHAFDAGQTSVEPLGRISDPTTTNRARSHSPAQQEIHKSPVAWPEAIGEDVVMRTLEEYQEQWDHDRNHKAQEAETITDEMRVEAMNLLQLFGVPYIEAPAEAEAQCVMLEMLGLVDGIVTEDSDVFVFGGKRVYKNIFDDQKYVEVYDAADAEREMNLTRDGLVALAMLLGGDYTEGVKGVGIVNGMEIIDAFDVSQDLKIGLEKFRKWLDGFNPFDSITVAKPGDDELLTKERVFHRKHQSARTRWIAPKFFPDPKVLNAYLHPVVDNSEERFTWAGPDMDRLILFCNKHVGWPADETRKMIQPVIEKIEQGRSMHQTRIDSFMRYEDGIQFANVRSKRLREVLENVKKQTSSSTKQAPSKRQKPSAAENKD